jgi:hypothetical protein
LVEKYPEAAERARIGDVVTAVGDWHDSDWFYPQDFYVLMHHGVALGESKRQDYTDDNNMDTAEAIEAARAMLSRVFPAERVGQN